MDSSTGHRACKLRSRRGFWLALVILGTTSTLLAILAPTPWIRALGAIPLILFLPGATLVASVLAERNQNNHDLWLLVPALSIIVTILGGTALATSHAFNAAYLAAYLGAISVAPAAWKAVTTSRTENTPALSRPARRQIAAAGAAGILFVSILTVALVLAAESEHRSTLRATSFALWAREVPNGVLMGLSTPPRGQVTVDVEVSQAGRLVAEWRDVTLGPGTHWSQVLSAADGPRLVIRVTESGRVVREIPVYSHPDTSES